MNDDDAKAAIRASELEQLRREMLLLREIVEHGHSSNVLVRWMAAVDRRLERLEDEVRR